MAAILDNPHVALNNARNLPKKGGSVPQSRESLPAEQKKRLLAFIKARQKRAECDEFIAKNKSDVFDILGKLPGGNFTQSNAMIYRADAISYQYPVSIIQMERDLADHKKIAQLSGLAKKIVKGCVKFEALG